MSIKAVSATTPLTTATPLSVGLDNTVGTAGSASRSDHTHAAKVQKAIVVLASDGTATMTFARSTVGKPAIACLYEESASNQPILIKASSWTTDGNGNYTGVTIQAYRAQTIPQNLVTLLVGGIYNLFGGGSLTGINVSVFVGDVTQ